MFKWIPVVIVVIFAMSCTKVINIDVRDSDRKYVIEGVITDVPGDCKVFITQSTNFNEENNFDKVDNAVVTIRDNGSAVLLERTAPGVYETAAITGTPGHIYELSVQVDGVAFTSTCTMPQAVDIDSLYIDKGPFGTFKFAHVWYTDPRNIDNGYRFIQYVNGVKEPTIFWDDDEFTDGDEVFNMLDVSAEEKDDPRNIKTGDEVTVQLLTIDEAVMKYWRSLRSGGGSGEGFSAAPANPLTNIEGGALGYFSAHTVRQRSVVAP